MKNLSKRIEALEIKLKPVPLAKIAFHYPDGTIKLDGRLFTNLAEYKAFISGINATIQKIEIVNQRQDETA